MSLTIEEREESIQWSKLRWSESKYLTLAEREEMIKFETDKPPVTVQDQFRKYLLTVKHCNPIKAEQMAREAKPMLGFNVYTEQEIHDLSVVMSRYVNGFILHAPPTQEALDEMSQEFYLPLKTLTLGTDAPYQVWRERSRTVLWKAWRQGRPLVCGYGMTEQEAIDELRYNVQPDHDGTLDGLGKPKGPVIGGNMFSASDVRNHNRERYAEK